MAKVKCAKCSKSMHRARAYTVEPYDELWCEGCTNRYGDYCDGCGTFDVAVVGQAEHVEGRGNLCRSCRVKSPKKTRTGRNPDGSFSTKNILIVLGIGAAIYFGVRALKSRGVLGLPPPPPPPPPPFPPPPPPPFPPPPPPPLTPPPPPPTPTPTPTGINPRGARG